MSFLLIISVALFGLALVCPSHLCSIYDYASTHFDTHTLPTLCADGTLRWQAPELMAGQNQLTTEIDVYAYAVCCVEILTMGSLPWPLMDDDAVRYFVLSTSLPQLALHKLRLIAYRGEHPPSTPGDTNKHPPTARAPPSLLAP